MAGMKLIEKKQATYYGIGLALNRLLQAIFNDETVVLCVMFTKRRVSTKGFIYRGSSNY